nr:kelch repeat-containing protein [Corallococcus exiguus]
MEVLEATATTSNARWTPPFCVTSGGSASFTVTVTNDLGRSTATHFAVTGLFRCQAWSSTGALTTGRSGHTATLLPSGKVLVISGCCNDEMPQELYDPSSGTWSSTSTPTTGRSYHTATLLPSGKVLMIGGFLRVGGYGYSDLYDPETDTWTPVTTPFMPRWGQTATLLASGKVLAAGGRTAGAYVEDSAMVYDPTAGTWSTTGSLTQYRDAHTATLLPSGRVLVVGGNNQGGQGQPAGGLLATCEVYRPETGTWSATEALAQAREGHTATLLLTGKVLVTGGWSGGEERSRSSELYDPASGTWSATGNLVTGRRNHTATLLPSGKVLVTGGSPDTTSELYDPASGTWSAVGNLATVRERHSATLLPSGRVLVTGGTNYLRASEVYTP